MNLQIPRKQELEAKIVDLEASLLALKQQLNRQEESETPYEALDNLEFYIELVDYQCESFRGFWSIMTEDLRAWCSGLLANRSTRNDIPSIPSSLSYRYQANPSVQNKAL